MYPNINNRMEIDQQHKIGMMNRCPLHPDNCCFNADTSQTCQDLVYTGFDFNLERQLYTFFQYNRPQVTMLLKGYDENKVLMCHSYPTFYWVNNIFQEGSFNLDLLRPGQNEVFIKTTPQNADIEDLALWFQKSPPLPEQFRRVLEKGQKSVSECLVWVQKHFKNTNDMEVEQSDIYEITLKCPISLKKIKLPARGGQCRHIQCFDLASFLLMNNTQQARWKCPICKKVSVWQSLVVDKYIKKILRSTDPDVDLIQIDSTGRWREVESRDEKKHHLIATQQGVIMLSNSAKRPAMEGKAKTRHRKRRHGAAERESMMNSASSSSEGETPANKNIKIE